MFENDIRQGPGKMTYASGNIVEGTWEKERLNGPGVLGADTKVVF